MQKQFGVAGTDEHLHVNVKGVLSDRGSFDRPDLSLPEVRQKVLFCRRADIKDAAGSSCIRINTCKAVSPKHP